MKTPVTSTRIPGLILSLSWLSLSFAQHDASHFAKPVADAAAPIASSRTTKPAEAVPSSSAMSAPKDFPPLPLPTQEALILKRQPPKIRLSPWTSEVLRLAESGIEAGVILAYIENSGTFNLGADQIVYLNDLGLSGEIINAMLQHDRDLISGIKPLTITSEPDSQFTFDSAREVAGAEPGSGIGAITSRAEDSAGENPVSGKALPRPSATPTRPADAADARISSGLEASPEINRPVALAPLAATETALPEEPANANRIPFTWQSQRADGKKSSYPVREPYPVEITAPIVFLHADGRIPNTLVVLGFPRSSP